MDNQDKAAIVAAVLTLIGRTNLHQRGLELSMQASKNIMDALTSLGELLVTTICRIEELEVQRSLHLEAIQTIVRRLDALEEDVARSWR